MALAGNLKDFGLPEILQLISVQQKTGILSLSAGGGTALVRFSGGTIIGVLKNGQKSYELLRQYLFETGILIEEQLEQIKKIGNESHISFENILVSANFISADNIKETIRFLTEEIIYELFSWKEGAYKFEISDNIVQGSWDVSIKTESVLMEGMRRLDEWPHISEILPKPKLVVARNENITLDSDELPSDERKLYGLVDGKKSLMALVQLSGLQNYRTYEALVNLLDNELIYKLETAPKDVIVRPIKKKSKLGHYIRSTFDTILVIILTIAIIIGSVLIRFTLVPITGSNFFSRLQAINEANSSLEIQNLIEILNLYIIRKGHYPASLNFLVNEGLITTDAIMGEGDLEYKYKISTDGMKCVIKCHTFQDFAIQLNKALEANKNISLEEKRITLQNEIMRLTGLLRIVAGRLPEDAKVKLKENWQIVSLSHFAATLENKLLNNDPTTIKLLRNPKFTSFIDNYLSYHKNSYVLSYNIIKHQ